MYLVNSYSIFGNYWHVLPLLLRSHFAIFSQKFELRIYHDDLLRQTDYYKKVLIKLQEKSIIKLIYKEDKVLKCRSMLWRMIPVWDPEVDYVFCKDADSIPTLRERKIMEEFVSSDYSVLGINDNPAHSIPLMGGMIGFNTKKFIKTSNINTFEDFMRLDNYDDNKWNIHGSDQDYLQQNILLKIKNDMILYRIFPGANSVNGIKCLLSIGNKIFNDINPVIQEHGDKFICYIGATGPIRDFEPEWNIIKNHNCKSVLEFFDKYGNQEINEIIREEER